MTVGKLQRLTDKFPSVGFIQIYGQPEYSPRATALLPRMQ